MENSENLTPLCRTPVKKERFTIIGHRLPIYTEDFDYIGISRTMCHGDVVLPNLEDLSDINLQSLWIRSEEKKCCDRKLRTVSRPSGPESDNCYPACSNINCEPRGPGNGCCTSSSFTEPFWSHAQQGSSIKTAFQGDFEPLSLSSQDEKILPDIDTMCGGGSVHASCSAVPCQLPACHSQQAAAVGNKSSIEGSGWPEVLRVGIATLSAIMIVDHGVCREDGQ